MSEAVLTMPVWLPHFYNLDTFEIILISWRSDIGKKMKLKMKMKMKTKTKKNMKTKMEMKMKRCNWLTR